MCFQIKIQCECFDAKINDAEDEPEHFTVLVWFELGMGGRKNRRLVAYHQTTAILTV